MNEDIRFLITILLIAALGGGCAGDGSSPPQGDPPPGDMASGDPNLGDPGGDEASGDAAGDPSSGDAGAGDPGGGDEPAPGDATVAVVGFDTIQLDLDNVGGTRGSHPSCTTAGAGCHQNMARNVWIIPEPNAQELQDNYDRIINTLGTPWVTPMNASAQMLNEVAIPPEVHARWLAWIEAGAPFDAP